MKSKWTPLYIGITLSLLTACMEDKPEPKPAPKAVTVQEEPELVSLEDALNEEVLTASTMETDSAPIKRSSQTVHSLTDSDFTPQIKSEGDYVLQVSTSSYQRDADAMVRKIKNLGYDAYTVNVENPADLQGSYIRVRLGYFSNVPDARSFGHNVLKPAGISFWIDNTENDELIGTSQSDVYEAPSQPEPVQQESIIEDEWGSPAKATPAEQTAPAPEVVEEPTVQEPAPVETPVQEATPAAQPAPANDDWGTPEAKAEPKVVSEIKEEAPATVEAVEKKVEEVKQEAVNDSWEAEPAAATETKEKPKAWTEDDGWE